MADLEEVFRDSQPEAALLVGSLVGTSSCMIGASATARLADVG